MNVQSNSKYRSVEFIENKINSFPSFSDYMDSISIGTAKNYKAPLMSFINNKVNEKQKEEYIRTLNKKIASPYSNNSLKNISEMLESILDDLEYLNKNEEVIISEEDIKFLLSIILLGTKINDDVFNASELIHSCNRSALMIEIKNNGKHLIRKRIELFKKGLLTLSEIKNKINISKASAEETIQKYFYSKNNFKKINIVPLQKVLELYFSKATELI